MAQFEGMKNTLKGHVKILKVKQLWRRKYTVFITELYLETRRKVMKNGYVEFF